MPSETNASTKLPHKGMYEVSAEGTPTIQGSRLVSQALEEAAKATRGDTTREDTPKDSHSFAGVEGIPSEDTPTTEDTPTQRSSMEAATCDEVNMAVDKHTQTHDSAVSVLPALVAAAELPPTPWERMKIVNEMKQDGSKKEHLAKVRSVMVGDKGPPLDEEVGYIPCCCCMCCVCCDPLRPVVNVCKSRTFHDERPDRPWKEILADMCSLPTLFWLGVCIIIFVGWGYLSWITMPGMMLTFAEGQIQTYWSMMYLDLVPNVLTAYVYHQYTCCHPLHKAEHEYIFQSKGVLAQFSVGAAYFIYFNCCTGPIYAVTILPALMTDKVDTHWECAIFFATWVQTVILFCIRILMWVMEQRPSMYSYAPSCWLNFMRFFRTHFTMAAFEYYESGRYEGRTLSTGYGNVMPFFDVCIGSCPFNVRYSVPFPFIDFITHSPKVWCEYVDPADIYWTPLQKIWYAFWFLFLAAVTAISFGVYWAPWGSCYPWYVGEGQWKFP